MTDRTKEARWKRELEELKALEKEDLVEELIGRYRPMVYAAARRLAPHMARDEDLLQCGLIGLWQAAERWDGERPFTPLARRCIANEMVTYLRQQARRPRTVPLEGQEGRAVYHQDFSGVELQAAVEESCPPGSKDRTLLLAVLAGYTPREAAQAAGYAPRRARARLRRAAGRLEDFIKI